MIDVRTNVINSDNKSVLHVCWLCMNPVAAHRSDFATHVPLRTAEMLGSKIQLHLVYMGALDHDVLVKQNIKTHRVQSNLVRIPVVRDILLFREMVRVGREYHVAAFENVWSFQKMPLIFLASRVTNALCIARISGVVAEIKKTDGLKKKIIKRLYAVYERISLNLCDRIHVLSQSLLVHYLDKGINTGKFRVISQGVNVKRFSFQIKGSRSQPFRLLIIARLEPVKSIKTSLDAVHLLRTCLNRNVMVTIAGEGSCEEELRQAVIRLKLQDSVQFYGYANHESVVGLYRQHDVLLLTSRAEGLPNVVLEAQSSGVPVIATKVGGVIELLSDGRGCLIDVGAERQLADAVMKLMDDSDLYNKIRTSALEYVKAEHAYEVLREKYYLMVSGK